MDIEVKQSKQLVLGEMLARWARKTPEREALVFKERRFSYRQFEERVNRLANGLSILGIDKGDRVVLIFMNCNELVECYLAMAKLGAISVPSNFRFSAQEHAYQLAHSGAKGLIFQDQFSAVVNEAMADLSDIEFTICTGKTTVPNVLNYEQLLNKSTPEPPQVYVDDDDAAWIMYTSGTTGKPKGAVLTHKNLAMCAILCLYYGLITEKWLVVHPLFHIGSASDLLFSIFSGSTVVITELTDPKNIMATIQEENIQSVTLVPELWNWIVNHPEFDKYDLSSLRLGLTGAAVISVERKQRIFECLQDIRLFEAFGMTETCGVGTIAVHGDIFKKPGSVGLPVFHMEVRIVDDNDRDVPVGEMGEIIYRGPAVLKEYYKNPEATEEAFKGGWFHSGDLVRQDDDGYIYVVDRKKDIIISGGENISAKEVEEVLLTHPKILEAAVVGIPDEKWGESVKAYVIIKQGEKLSEEMIISYCKDKMASFKKPRFVVFVEDLPRTALGKVKKFELKQMARKKAD